MTLIVMAAFALIALCPLAFAAPVPVKVAAGADRR